MALAHQVVGICGLGPI